MSENIGILIHRLREEKKMTLEELGDKVGVWKSNVRKWENGMIQNMRRDKVAKLAAALGVSPAYLMGWPEENEASPKEEYYLNPETAEIAQDIFENKELRMLFSVQRDMDPEDLKALHNMALALKRKEGYDGDDPA